MSMRDRQDDSVRDRGPFTPAGPVPGDVQIQPAGFLLELSADWLILRASENIHEFLGEYHVRLIGEPLANFLRTQPLHDLRNAVSRQSGSSGIARVYRVRLIDHPRCFDLAFQLSNGRLLLEGIDSSDESFGAAFGSVGGLIDGLVANDDRGLLDGAARRMRALTGFDRVVISVGPESVVSSRGNLAPPEPAAASGQTLDLPSFVADTAAAPVSLFPRTPSDRAPERAVLRSPSAQQLEELRARGVRSALNIPLMLGGERAGLIECEDRNQRVADFELHAAAELFAQLFALRVEIGRLQSRRLDG